MQAIRHDETIRHAVVALSALHEQFENCEGLLLRCNKGAIENRFAVEHYVKAISSLLEPSAVPTGKRVHIFLVACLLFSFFEVISMNTGSEL